MSSGRPAGSADGGAALHAFLLGVLSTGEKGAKVNSNRWGPYPGRYAVSAFAKKRNVELFGAGVHNKAMTALAALSPATLSKMTIALRPALKGGKDLQWVVQRFSSRAPEAQTRYEVVARGIAQTGTILRVLILDNPDDSAVHLYPKYVGEVAKTKYPSAVRELRDMTFPAFEKMLPIVAEPRVKHPGLLLTDADKAYRFAYSMNVSHHPLTCLPELLVHQIQRSVAADEYSYDHNDVLQKNPTGWVPRRVLGTSDKAKLV